MSTTRKNQSSFNKDVLLLLQIIQNSPGFEPHKLASYYSIVHNTPIRKVLQLIRLMDTAGVIELRSGRLYAKEGTTYLLTI